MASISLLIVAEKSSVRCSSGMPPRISFRSSWNPIVSISSASSSTTFLTVERSAAPRFIRSMRRPGVATNTLMPRFRARICASMLVPPYTGRMCTPSECLENPSRSSAICRHSSRVGASISDTGCMGAPSVSCTMGRPYAAVLPVPVCASATRSPCHPLSSPLPKSTGITAS